MRAYGRGRATHSHAPRVERAGFSSLAEGAKVSFDIVQNRGKESAIRGPRIG